MAGANRVRGNGPRWKATSKAALPQTDKTVFGSSLFPFWVRFVRSFRGAGKPAGRPRVVRGLCLSLFQKATMTKSDHLTAAHDLDRFRAEVDLLSGAMKFRAEVDIAQAQEAGRRLQSAFDAVSAAIQATGATLARYFVQSVEGGCHGLHN